MLFVKLILVNCNVEMSEVLFIVDYDLCLYFFGINMEFEIKDLFLL